LIVAVAGAFVHAAEAFPIGESLGLWLGRLLYLRLRVGFLAVEIAKQAFFMLAHTDLLLFLFVERSLFALQVLSYQAFFFVSGYCRCDNFGLFENVDVYPAFWTLNCA
jgi:hypothetical protein